MLGLLPGERPLVVNIHATVGGVSVREGKDYTFHYDPNDPLFGQVDPITVWDPIPATYDVECSALVNAGVIFPVVPDTTIGFTPLIFDGLDPAYVRKDMHALSYMTESVDRPISLKLDDNWPMGVPYVYP